MRRQVAKWALTALGCKVHPTCSQMHTSASSCMAASGAQQPSAGIIEVREYLCKPSGLAPYVKLTEQYSMFLTDVGGPISKLTHFYSYKDFDERDSKRAAAGKDPRWQVFIASGRGFLESQSSRIFLEAQPVRAALSLPPTAQYQSPTRAAVKESDMQPIYELRNYQLHPGYGAVPRLVEAFAKGLPSKVAADPFGSLVFFGHTDVGVLNNVLEVWRYPSAQHCIKARQAARGVAQWKETIATVTPGVQHFTSEFTRPLNWSPWQ